MRQKGIAQITVLIILLGLVVAAAAASYYILKKTGKAPSLFTSAPTPIAEISDSDDPDVIEAELDATTIDSVDADLKELETSASSL